MKSLLVRLGLLLLLALVVSCGAGFGVVRAGGSGIVVTLRDVAVIILALLFMVMTLIWAVIYFGVAWAIGRFGPKGAQAVRWLGSKVLNVEGLAVRGSEQGIIRPLARVVRQVTTWGTLVQRLITPAQPLLPDGAPTQEIRRWRSYVNRVNAWRRGATRPPGLQTPSRAGPEHATLVLHNDPATNAP